jgi:hypothetical protein
MLLYYIHILEELEDFEAALSSLDQNAESKCIVDRMSLLETRGMISVTVIYHLLRFMQLDCSPK